MSDRAPADWLAESSRRGPVPGSVRLAAQSLTLAADGSVTLEQAGAERLRAELERQTGDTLSESLRELVVFAFVLRKRGSAAAADTLLALTERRAERALTEDGQR